MTEFEDAIAAAQAAAQAAIAESEQYVEQGYTVEQVQDLYPEPVYEQPAEPAYVPEPQGTEGAPAYYPEQEPEPMPFDWMIEKGTMKAVETVLEKVIVGATEVSSSVVGIVLGCIFELSSDQASHPAVAYTTEGYQAVCPGYHDAYGTTWSGPYRPSRGEAELDLDQHAAEAVHFDSFGTELGTGGGYQ